MYFSSFRKGPVKNMNTKQNTRLTHRDKVCDLTVEWSFQFALENIIALSKKQYYEIKASVYLNYSTFYSKKWFYSTT